MAQQEVIDVLEKAKKPLAAQEVTKIIKKRQDINEKRIFVILSRLLKNHEIGYIEIPRGEAMEKFGVKRRMRLYYTIK